MRCLVGLVVLWSACGPTVRGELRDAREARTPPGEFVVRWAEPPGPLGGQELVLRGGADGGVLTHQRFRPSFLTADDAPETRLAGAGPSLEDAGDDAPGPVAAEAAVSAEALLGLVELLLEVEAWEAPEPSVLAPPLDGREATLEIRVGGSRSRVLVALADLPSEGRLVRVREALLGLLGAR
ncbi:MAG: hypothetical protein AAF447_07605 [Myxococcota bacterium]